MGQWSHGKLIGTDEMYYGWPGFELVTFRETQALYSIQSVSGVLKDLDYFMNDEKLHNVEKI